MLRSTLSALALFASCVTVAASEFTSGTLVIQDVTAFETAPTAKAAGGYMRIENTGDADDRLIGVEADFPRVELHTTEEKDGVARMMHVDGIDVPAGGTAILQPGALHVMFMGLGEGQGFSAGDEVPAVLIFENAGPVSVVFDVIPR